MIYTMRVEDIATLPDYVYEKILDWLKVQGIDPNRLHTIAYNYERRETFVKEYKTLDGRAVWDDDFNPVFLDSFVPLAGDNHPPYLEYFHPSEPPPVWLGEPSSIQYWES